MSIPLLTKPNYLGTFVQKVSKNTTLFDICLEEGHADNPILYMTNKDMHPEPINIDLSDTCHIKPPIGFVFIGQDMLQNSSVYKPFKKQFGLSSYKIGYKLTKDGAFLNGELLQIKGLEEILTSQLTFKK